jgi:hypothetical protein
LADPLQQPGRAQAAHSSHAAKRRRARVARGGASCSPLAFQRKLSDIRARGRLPHPSDRIMTGPHRLPTLLRLALVVLAAMPAAAFAQSPEYLGTYRDWNVYRFADGDQSICYMASEPKKQEGNYTRRGNPAILVTRRPAPRVVDEVSVQPGYSYQDGSEVEVQVDRNRKFLLFTRGEHAWTKSEDADEALIRAMKGGNDLTVRGTSVKNTYSLDTFSLLGFTAAYDAMVEACSEES